MEAIVIDRYGGPEVLHVEQLERPKPRDNEVVIRVYATSVNPIDWRIREGEMKLFIRKSLPMILGCDLAGEVVEVGRNARRLAVGQQVYAMMPHDYGAYAELVALDENLVVPKPAPMSMEEAASVPVTAVTALQALRDLAGARGGQRVLVNGASGGVGLFAVQIAKALGAHVTGVCSEDGAKMVKGLGADELIDYKKTDFTSGDAKYDVIFDCVGSKSFAACKRVLEKGGAYVTTTPGPSVFLRQLLNVLSSHRCYGVIAKARGTDLEYVRTLIEKGSVKTIIDKSYSFAEVADAQRYSKSGRAKGKIVLRLQAPASQEAA